MKSIIHFPYSYGQHRTIRNVVISPRFCSLLPIDSGEIRSAIRIPEWDYNWQEQYDLKEPLRLPKGTLLRVRATYDNSAENPNNPSAPPRPVRLGEQTTNEMCFVFVGVSTRSTALTLITPAGPLFPKGK